MPAGAGETVKPGQFRGPSNPRHLGQDCVPSITWQARIGQFDWKIANSWHPQCGARVAPGFTVGLPRAEVDGPRGRPGLARVGRIADEQTVGPGNRKIAGGADRARLGSHCRRKNHGRPADNRPRAPTVLRAGSPRRLCFHKDGTRGSWTICSMEMLLMPIGFDDLVQDVMNDCTGDHPLLPGLRNAMRRLPDRWPWGTTHVGNITSIGASC